MFESFNALIQITDRIVSNIKNRNDLEEQFFSEFLKPFFDEFEKTAQNYFRFFHTFRTILYGSNNWASSIDNIKEMRQELRTQRMKLMASVEGLDRLLMQYGDKTIQYGYKAIYGVKKEKHFALLQAMMSVQFFFVEGASFNPEEREHFPSIAERLDRVAKYRADNPGRTRSRVLVELFEFLAHQDKHYLDNDEDQSKRKQELIDYTERTIQDLEKNWHNAVMNHVKLQLLINGQDKVIKNILK